MLREKTLMILRVIVIRQCGRDSFGLAINVWQSFDYRRAGIRYSNILTVVKSA